MASESNHTISSCSCLSMCAFCRGDFFSVMNFFWSCLSGHGHNQSKKTQLGKQSCEIEIGKENGRKKMEAKTDTRPESKHEKQRKPLQLKQSKPMAAKRPAKSCGDAKKF